MGCKEYVDVFRPLLAFTPPMYITYDMTLYKYDGM